MQKTGRLKAYTLTDEHDSTWTLKELKKYVKELETEVHHVQLFFDGGFSQEQKIAGLGVVIYFTQNAQHFRIRLNEQLELMTSNNEAEYAALLLALEQLEQLDVHHQTIDVFGDSQVVIREMNGEWAITDSVLQTWAQKIDDKLLKLGLTANYYYIDRNANKEADQLATQALEGTVIFANQPVKRKK